MKAQHAVVAILLCILILPAIPVIPDNQSVNSNEVTAIETPTAEYFEPSGAYGEDPLVANIIPNSGFEDVQANGAPSDWNYYGSTHQRVNGSYQDLVHTGSYSGLLETQGSDTSSGNAQFYFRYTSGDLPHLSQDITFDMNYYLVSVPDTSISWSYVNLYVGIYDDATWHYLYYYLSHNNGYNPTNDSQRTYFLLNSSTGGWHSFSRNITSDYEDRFGPINSNTRLYDCQWYLNNMAGETTASSFVIDETSIHNSTAKEFLLNNDFEDGTGNPWGTYAQGPASIEPSQDASVGTRSTNITVASAGEGTSSYFNLEKNYHSPDGWFVQGPETATIEFDWKYEDTDNGGTEQYSYFWIRLYNTTNDIRLYWYLGRDLDQNNPTNSSNYFYFNATGFGARGSWQHQYIDLYELFIELKFNNITINELTFRTNVGTHANSSVTLLLDEFEYRAYPTSDPGFEEDWYHETYHPITGWHDAGEGIPYLDRTSDSHSGDWATNITLDGSRNSAVYREFFLPIDGGIYTDFWWRLDDVSHTTGTCISYLQLRFEGGYSISYVLGAAYTLGNNSNNGYYYANGFNETGTWTNLVRNVQSDVIAVFGENQWNLTEVRFYSLTTPGDSISTIVDDVHFIRDTHAPVVTSVTRETVSPNYYQSTQIRSEATDIGLTGITLHFNNGSWFSSAMTDMGSYFEGYIPYAPFNTTIEFYVNATDSGGLYTVDDNSSAFYSYVIGDDVDPTIDVTGPYDGITVSGFVTFSLDVSDPDIYSSGLDYVELWDGSTLLLTVTNSLSTFNWSSRTVANGSHSLGVKVFDIAGNFAMDNVTLDVQNDVVAPMLSTVTLNPQVPVFYEDVTVYVAVVDATSIENVTLFYRVDSGEWTAALMLPSGALYASVIPAESWNTEVEYYIVAFDTFGLSAFSGTDSDPLSYVVNDDIAPTLSVSGPPSGSVLQGVVEFTVSGADVGSSIIHVEMSVNGVSDSTGSSVPTSFNWDTTTVDNGAYTVLFEVQDGAGNTATITFEFTVNNPQGIEAVGSALTDFISQYGFFVGAITIVVVYIIFKLLMKRRGSS